MATQIMNGGIEGGILRIIKDSGDQLTPKQEERLTYLESLPKNEWVSLDEEGKAISNEEAKEREVEHLKKFKTPDGNSII